MIVEKISVKKISDSVVEEIEKLISTGKFKAGEKLPSVREMCDLFGVGRSAVRDAIITLKGKGAVVVKQGEGTFIREFDSSELFRSQLLQPGFEDIGELFQARKILETGIAEIAALKRSAEDLGKMKGILSENFDQPSEKDYLFHRAIAQASRNEVLIQFVQFISSTLKKTMAEFHACIEKDEKAGTSIAKQHMRIYAAIVKADGNEAKQAMADHLNHVEALMKTKLRK